MENIFWNIPFLPDTKLLKTHEKQKVAKQVINPTSHLDSNKFPGRNKIALKLLLCNLFQMYIKLIDSALCLFLEPTFPKRKKVKNVGLGWCSPLLGLPTATIWHYVYQFDIWYNAGTFEASQIPRWNDLSGQNLQSHSKLWHWPSSVKHSDLNAFHHSYPFSKCTWAGPAKCPQAIHSNALYHKHFRFCFFS